VALPLEDDVELVEAVLAEGVGRGAQAGGGV
jgi:hypothetical protein